MGRPATHSTSAIHATSDHHGVANARGPPPWRSKATVLFRMGSGRIARVPSSAVDSRGGTAAPGSPPAPRRAHLEFRGVRRVGVVDGVSPHVCGCTLGAARAGLRPRSRMGRARRGRSAVELAGGAVVLARLCLTRVPTPRRRQASWRLSSGPARAMEAPGPPSRTRPGRGPRVPDST